MTTITVTVQARSQAMQSYRLIVTRSQIGPAYFKSSNPGEDDQFGYVIALWGDTLAVGAPWESSKARGVNGDLFDNSLKGSGAVYIIR